MHAVAMRATCELRIGDGAPDATMPRPVVPRFATRASDWSSTSDEAAGTERVANFPCLVCSAICFLEGAPKAPLLLLPELMTHTELSLRARIGWPTSPASFAVRYVYVF